MSLSVRNLTIAFGDKVVVDDVSFDVDRGERLAIIGESGSGKTLTLMAILGLLPLGATVSGSITFEGTELLGASEETMCHIRGNKIGVVFQEPATALNPTSTIGTSLTMAQRIHKGLPKKEAKKKAVELAASVNLPQPELIVSRYPHELSGGQRQRVVIAMAMSCDPTLLLADEPTTALDATVQSRILHIMDGQRGPNASLVLVTHDMAVAHEASDRVIVMKDGKLVEEGATLEIITRPRTETTKALIAAARATGLSR